ncbi:hypothetical protein F5878DRAFT_455055 [Lentinula raphanica]|uniref:Uncharacterized protein n=1 Tax=Lentinula raphanica TaxID=153919 RepID=A0AA38U544_9AGAR|nr:hypothetical protein F5878DRAFT_455055 [Lentinula raphanica]
MRSCQNATRGSHTPQPQTKSSPTVTDVHGRPRLFGANSTIILTNPHCLSLSIPLPLSTYPFFFFLFLRSTVFLASYVLFIFNRRRQIAS